MIKYPCVAIHVKTGNIYTLLHVATDATNDREGTSVAVYSIDDKVYVRDLSEFLNKFELSAS
jgi:hypothetical protein